MSTVKLFIGTIKGAFTLTFDQTREHWMPGEPQFKGWEVLCLNPDPRKEGRMFAATGSHVYGATVHVSSDAGMTWKQIEHGPCYSKDSGMKLNRIWNVVPGASSEPEVAYAGVDEAGIFRTEDGGDHWTELTGLSHHETRAEWAPGAGGLCCHSILIDPSNPKRITVGISAVGIFRSDDGGETWEPKNDGLEIVVQNETHKHIGTCVHNVVMDPGDPKRLFQQNHRGLFRSYNAGDTWERIENGIDHNFGFPMVMHPHDATTLFIVPQESDEFRFAKEGRLAVFRTTNAGDHWTEHRDGLPAHSYVGVLRKAMTVDQCADPGVYFGTTSGQIFFSKNNANSWCQLPITLPRILWLAATEA